MTSDAITRSNKSSRTAMLLEILFGGLFQVFGTGYIYAERVNTGFLLMISYWAVQIINIALMTIVVGFLTFPITWLVYLVLCARGAAHAAASAGREAQPLLAGD